MATASCRWPARTSSVNGVTVVGLTNPPASMPTHASFLYARNIANFLGLLVKDGELAPDFDDEIVAGTCVVRDGHGGARPDRRGAGPRPARRPVASDGYRRPPTPPATDAEPESKEAGS